MLPQGRPARARGCALPRTDGRLRSAARSRKLGILSPHRPSPRLCPTAGLFSGQLPLTFLVRANSSPALLYDYWALFSPTCPVALHSEVPGA